MDALGIAGAWVFTPRIHCDNRGTFHEWFVGAELDSAAGYRFGLSQANCSVSSRGVVRGIHFTDTPPGQAKYVACVSGAILDVVVDVRVGSPTFGRHEAVRLDEQTGRAVFLAEGLGHSFMALTENAVVVYLCSTPYAPAIEHGVNPLDPAIGIAWPGADPPVLSAKDAAAPSLAEAEQAGLLPSYEACMAHLANLRA
jgi:dTDP-4-dehydrorhamnose 3,5-epimerase